MLQRQVDIFDHLRLSCHDLQQRIGHTIRVAIQHTNPVKTVDFTQLGQQFIQGILAVQVLSIAGGILCDQIQLLDTACCQSSGFLEDVLHLAGAESAANQRDGTEAASVVAALCNLQISRIVGGTQHPVAVERQVCLIPKGRYSLSVQRLLDRLCNLGVAADAQHNVCLRDFTDQLVAVTLCQTAGHHQHLDLSLIFQLRKFKDGFDGFSFGVLDKTTGIDDDHIALLCVRADFISVVDHQCQQDLGVHLIF